MALCADPDVKAVPGTAQFTSPDGIDVTTVLLKPLPISSSWLCLPSPPEVSTETISVASGWSRVLSMSPPSRLS